MVDVADGEVDDIDGGPVDLRSMRAPITALEWIALPLLYVGAISLPSFYAAFYNPTPHSALEWAFLVAGTVLALGATAAVAASGFRCYRADEIRRPHEARAYFRMIYLWGAIYLLDWSIAIIVNAGWGGIYFPLGAGAVWLALLWLGRRSSKVTVS
jgi:hypothetical protein